MNNTVEPSVNEVTLHVNGMSPNRIYSIQIAALNAEGKGPFSAPLQIEIDQLQTVKRDPSFERMTQVTWVVVVVAALSILVVLISAFVVHRRKKKLEFLRSRNPLGYFEESTEDFHRCHLARQSQQQLYAKDHQQVTEKNFA